MTKFYGLLLFALFVASGCSIEDRLERREDKLMGSWIFDKARFDEDGDLFNDNVIDDFRGDIITFYSDFTCTYDAANGQVFEGVWVMNAVRDQIDGESDVEFLLDIDFFNLNDSHAFTWLGTLTYLTRNRLTLHVHERTGKFIFKFDRLD